MPNRTILFATALFLVLVIGFIVSPRNGSLRSPKLDSNQDFTIIIPETDSKSSSQETSIHESFTEPVVELSEGQKQQALLDIPAKHHITLSSKKMADHKQWFPLDFLGHETFNPSIMPHPHPLKFDQFIMVAQSANNATGFYTELLCPGNYRDGALKCLEEPVVLPVASSVSDKCHRKLDHYNYQVGPHDARAFYGPFRPYLIYGSPSSHTCMGVWMQDLSRLYNWDYQERLNKNEPFFLPTDLQRPAPYNAVEKNWFPFWDRAGELYLHYDTAPTRSFAKVNATGGIGPDLAPAARAADEACIAQYLPKITHPGYEKIQQATNSLMVTLCDRDDPTCFESEENTFIVSIVHHKMSFGRDVFDPYVVLFKRTPPFELHAISKVPFKISGQGRKPLQAAPATGALAAAAAAASAANAAQAAAAFGVPAAPAASAALPPTVADSTSGTSDSSGTLGTSGTSGTSGAVKRAAENDFHYITSINWKPRGNNYQGYLNHELLISFGVGDKSSGAIDVLAADLFDMKNYGVCGS